MKWSAAYNFSIISEIRAPRVAVRARHVTPQNEAGWHTCTAFLMISGPKTVPATGTEKGREGKGTSGKILSETKNAFRIRKWETLSQKGASESELCKVVK